MNVDDDYDDDDDSDDYYDYHDDDYDDDFHYDDDGYDDAIVGSMVQVVEAATNTTACIPASAADPRGSATNPRPQHSAHSLVQFKACRLCRRPPPPLPPTRRLTLGPVVKLTFWIKHGHFG